MHSGSDPLVCATLDGMRVPGVRGDCKGYPGLSRVGQGKSSPELEVELQSTLTGEPFLPPEGLTLCEVWGSLTSHALWMRCFPFEV